jgi:hypothetical protein
MVSIMGQVGVYGCSMSCQYIRAAITATFATYLSLVSDDDG